ncbi:MAG TPA: hypothetical protein VFJ58_05250, partial [Armatimonadota bacterium]|nr:hypothetical protein [Armatimonadota bacterium]
PCLTANRPSISTQKGVPSIIELIATCSAQHGRLESELSTRVPRDARSRSMDRSRLTTDQTIS